MIHSSVLVNHLYSLDYKFFSGVPDSIFRGLIYTIESRKELIYIPATRENISVACCTGAWMAGNKSAALMQNSGLGNCLDTLVSLNQTYKLPILLIIAWRGLIKNDEPQHWLWGDYQQGVLKGANIPAVEVLNDSDLIPSISKADEIIKNERRPVAVVIKRGVLIETL